MPWRGGKRETAIDERLHYKMPRACDMIEKANRIVK
jgi:hypothetical protein